MRPFLKSTLLFLGVIFFTIGCAEVLVRYTVFSKEDRAKGAEALWHSHRNLYSSGKALCALVDSLFPSPYLSYTHQSSDCAQEINNVGIMDRGNYPLRHDPKFFTIAILGGSVASQIASDDKNWIENALNTKYESPSGRPFKLVSAAIGGWHYPNQLTFLSLYGDSIDAAVAVDGFNEAEIASNHFPIYFPDPISYKGAMRSLRFPTSTLLIFFDSELRSFALAHSLTAKSYILYGFFLALTNLEFKQVETPGPGQGIQVGAFLQFPPEWTIEEKDTANKKKYANYIKLLASTAAALNLRYAHFVQPNRLLGKDLTEAEKGYAQVSSAKFYEDTFVAPSRELAAKGLNTFALTSIYEKERGTIYGDQVHSAFQAPGVNRGYEIMGDAIADKVAQFWHLKKKAISSR